MENQINIMSVEEVDELRKSLTDLGMEETEVNSYIEKAMKVEKKEEKESSSEQTMGEKAEKTGEANETSADEAKETPAEQAEEKKEGEEKPIVKSEDKEEDLEKCLTEMKSKKAEIEKSIDEMELKMGKKKPEEKKEEEIHKSVDIDIEKAFGERFMDIEKSLTEKFEDKFDEQNEIIKSLQSEIKKIGDTPMGTKSVITKATFFEKSLSNEEDVENAENKTLSISGNKDEILKGMEDMLNKEKDADVRQVIENGILDYTVNTRPTGHGYKALALLAHRKNITLEQ